MGLLKRILGAASDTPRPSPQFAYPLVTVRGREAKAAFAELKAQCPGQGFCPVLLGGDQDVERINEFGSYVEQVPAQLLAMARDIDPQAWFQDIREQDPGYFEAETGQWPKKARPVSDITAHRKVLTGLFKPWVHIAKVPAEYSWEIPCFLKLGDWNDCPSPSVHTALAKYWHERYGADIAATTGETVDFTVQSPPGDREAAEALALEHFFYCPDAVHQGAESIRGLAAQVLDAPVWTFWWD